MCCERLRQLLAPTFYWPLLKLIYCLRAHESPKKKNQAYFGSSLGFHVICILLQSFSQKVNCNQLSMSPIL